VRYALRSLARRPAFSFAAVVTLAVGVGASAVIFSVIDGVLLEPLPYPSPHRIDRQSAPRREIAHERCGPRARP